MEDLVAYFDGDFLPASKINLNIDNMGFTRGYGAYECFRTYKREAFCINDHINRLKHTCKQLLIPFPNEDLIHITKSLIEKNPGCELVFRVYVLDNSTNGSYHLVFLCNTPDHFDKTHVLNRDLKLQTAKDIRPHKNIKSTSYAIASIAIKKAKMNGFDDILFVGADGFVHELSRANFFAIKGNALYTPKEDFLPGITRKVIINIAKDFGFDVMETHISLEFLQEMDEVFASSTIRNITPIAQINDLLFEKREKTNMLKSFFTSLASYDDNHDKKHLFASHS